MHAAGIFPFTENYRFGQKRLCFIAARHVADPASATHRLIDARFAEFEPEAVVLEGLSPLGPVWDAESEAHYVDKAQQRMAQQPPWIPEQLYALLRAKGAGTRVFSGEPSDALQAAHLLACGYTAEDYFYFDFLLSIDHWKLRKLPDTELYALWDRHSEGQATLATSGQRFLFADFERWFGNISSATFGLEKMDGSFIAPDADAKFGTLRHIASALSHFRDRNCLAVIEDAVNAHDRVLVVYGGSHFFTLKPALEEQLGQPVPAAR